MLYNKLNMCGKVLQLWLINVDHMRKALKAGAGVGFPFNGTSISCKSVELFYFLSLSISSCCKLIILQTFTAEFTADVAR